MSALTRAALPCPWGRRQDRAGRKECPKCTGAEEVVPCRRLLAPALPGCSRSGRWLCPAPALCLAVPREEKGCACGFWLCGTSRRAAVWGRPGSAPGRGPGRRGSGTGVGIRLCPAILGAGRRSCPGAARGRLLPAPSAAAALASGHGRAGDDPVPLPLPGRFWLLWALRGRFHWVFSVGSAQLRLVFGPVACSGWARSGFVLCPAQRWVSGCAARSVAPQTCCGARRGWPGEGAGPGQAQPALGPRIVWWLVPETPLTERRGCSNLRLLLLCSSGQKRAFFGLSPELSRCHFSLPSPSSAGSAGQPVPTARGSREGRVAPAWEGDGHLLWVTWGSAGRPDC